MPTIEPLRDEVDHARGDHDRPEQRVAHEEPERRRGRRATRRSAATRLPARTTSAIVRNEKTYVQASIDEHGRRARRRDQHAGEHRAGELRQLVRAAEDRVDLA